jgi:hypothetical protein
MLAAGASSYTAIERFVGDYRGPVAKEWYASIEESWPRFMPEIPWPADLKGSTFPESVGDRVDVVDSPIEEAEPKRPCDVVCSFQVGEHVADIESFARIHRQLMAPDGVAVHRVDFAPHGRWEAYDDPLTFLRVPDPVWSLMGSKRGLPNRRRHHEFLAAFDAAGLTVETVEVERFNLERIDRSKLPPRFTRMPEESIAVSAAVYVCRLAPRAPGAARSTSVR